MSPLVHYTDSSKVCWPQNFLLKKQAPQAERGGGGPVSSVFPQEPPSGTLPSCGWFFVLPVWQPVCKQYVTVLHRAAKPHINGVARVPQGPAPRGVSLLAVLLGCVCFYYYVASLMSGRCPVPVSLSTCVSVSGRTELSAAESQPGTLPCWAAGGPPAAPCGSRLTWSFPRVRD